MTRLLSCRVRMAAVMILVGLAAATLAPDARAAFMYAAAIKVTNNTGKDATDFDVVLDAAPEKPNIVGNVPGAPIQKGPFNALIQQDTNVKTQKKAHFVGGGPAKNGQTYKFGFGLRQEKNVKVTFVSADWTDKDGKSIGAVPVAGFKVDPVNNDDPMFTIFDDSSFSFDLVGVSTKVNSAPLDLSTIDPGNAPGFTSQPGTFPLNPGESKSFTMTGGVPGTFDYIQGFVESGGTVTEAFIYAKALAPPVPEPSTFTLLGAASLSLSFWWAKKRSRTAQPGPRK